MLSYITHSEDGRFHVMHTVLFLFGLVLLFCDFFYDTYLVMLWAQVLAREDKQEADQTKLDQC